MPTFPISDPNRTLVGPNGPLAIDLNPDRPTVLVGANGSGKTRLAAEIDRVFTPNRIATHRISAHRALNLRPEVAFTSLESAQKLLWYGQNQPVVEPTYKFGSRWQNEPATRFLDDFEPLLQVLFAEESRTSSEFRRQSQQNRPIPVLFRCALFAEVFAR
jgi:ABC-type molybdenum transport system ATPase subunit/photorepair protein PhrA